MIRYDLQHPFPQDIHVVPYHSDEGNGRCLYARSICRTVLINAPEGEVRIRASVWEKGLAPNALPKDANLELVATPRLSQLGLMKPFSDKALQELAVFCLSESMDTLRAAPEFSFECDEQ